MVVYSFCPCGKVVDEYESKCHWCGLPAGDSESILGEDDYSSSGSITDSLEDKEK